MGSAGLDVAAVDGLGAVVVFFGFDVGAGIGGCGADAPGLGKEGAAVVDGRENAAGVLGRDRL